MSFLIKIAENQFNDISLIHSYETELIYSVANMNRIFVENFEIPSFCLGCLGIRYVDYKSKSGYIEIDHISQMIEKGYGKCDSIVAWFITLFDINGIESQPLIVPSNKGGFHVKLQFRENNQWIIIDPAINLDKIIFENCNDCKLKMINGDFRKRKVRL